MINENELKLLFDAAEKAMENSYSPYSNHPVGAAILTDNGRIFSGTNVESSNYDGLCAEAVAIGDMAKHGERSIKAVAVVGPGKHLCAPCGRCRQRINDFAKAATEIHVFSKSGELLLSSTMDELLSYSFGRANVEEMKP